MDLNLYPVVGEWTSLYVFKSSMYIVCRYYGDLRSMTTTIVTEGNGNTSVKDKASLALGVLSMLFQVGGTRTWSDDVWKKWHVEIPLLGAALSKDSSLLVPLTHRLKGRPRCNLCFRSWRRPNLEPAGKGV